MSQIPSKDPKILIVDDKPSNILLLEGVLEEADFTNFKSINDSRETMATFQEFKPDIILLDLHMPNLNGFEVMKQINDVIPPDAYLPILVLTADVTTETKRRALSDGATDFLTKPFDPVEVLLRIRNLFHTRSLQIQLQNQNQILDLKVRERTKELEESRLEILDRLARAAEYRDDDTGEHTQRVGKMAGDIAARLGLPREQVKRITLAAPLHDLGKIGIPDAILLKPGKLNSEEWEIMKTHTTIGANIISGSNSPILQLAEEIALTHHERWDGTGYMGMAGEDIPLSGRIVAVVDVFDALTHERPYKNAWPVEKALAEIEQQSGKQFDPHIVKLILGNISESMKTALQ